MADSCPLCHLALFNLLLLQMNGTHGKRLISDKQVMIMMMLVIFSQMLPKMISNNVPKSKLPKMNFIYLL